MTFSNLVPAMISNFPKYYNFTFVAPLNKRTALSTETKHCILLIKDMVVSVKSLCQCGNNGFYTVPNVKKQTNLDVLLPIVVQLKRCV